MKQYINLFFLLMIFIVLYSGCSTQYPPLETVPYVDLSKYTGKWYEIASFPNSFQKGCNCTTAEYSLEDDYVRVINRCRKDSINGELDEARGRAFVVEGSNNSRLKVQFFWPFKGDYYIIDLASDYSYSVVGSPSRKYLWILSRNKLMDKTIFQGITERAQQKGFDIAKLRMTMQD